MLTRLGLAVLAITAGCAHPQLDLARAVANKPTAAQMIKTYALGGGHAAEEAQRKAAAFKASALWTCVRVYAVDERNQYTLVQENGDGSQRPTLTAPTGLIVSVGGKDRSDDCKAWITNNLHDDDFLILGTYVWNTFDMATFPTAAGVDKLERKLSKKEIENDDGVDVIVSSNYLRVENTAFLYLRAIVGQQISDLNNGTVKQSFASLRILDTHLANLFGYTATVPILIRATKAAKDVDQYAMGASAAILWYPLRVSKSVENSFARDLAIEGEAGYVAGLNGSKAKSFFFLGLGLSWRGLLGVGWAFNPTADVCCGSYGVYFNIALFSERGFFSFLPVGKK